MNVDGIKILIDAEEYSELERYRSLGTVEQLIELRERHESDTAMIGAYHDELRALCPWRRTDKRGEVIAVDFDGTLCKSAWPDIGEANVALILALKRARKRGVTTILWTMREGQLLQDALDWCERRGLHFDAVNDNAPLQKMRYGNNPRKVYADIYIDDKNMDFGASESLWLRL